MDFENDRGYFTAENDIFLYDDVLSKENVKKVENGGNDEEPVGDEPDEEYHGDKLHANGQVQKTYKLEFVWRNIIVMALYHVFALIGVYMFFYKAKWVTCVWAYACAIASGFGITAGAHRLWAHKSYKAKLPLRLILLTWSTIAVQNSIIEWVRDHRVHHKFTDTDADPHNSTRGFFFSHMGWLLVRKHEDVKIKGKKVSVQDLWDDPIVRFQHNYYPLLVLIFGVIIPIGVPVWFWKEELAYSIFISGALRYIISLHHTWCINSIAHLYGNRPYDQRICPRQNIWAAILAFGEGWHNFHHKFPRDYRTSEYPAYWFNPTKTLIDVFFWIGWAYDAHVTNTDSVLRTKLRHGDGTD